ncbi:MAG: hypothetical protein AVDCRST_MAG49-1500, partial [uncultured Thermomicrobiales bacterium]
ARRHASALRSGDVDRQPPPPARLRAGTPAGDHAGADAGPRPPRVARPLPVAGQPRRRHAVAGL